MSKISIVPNVKKYEDLAEKVLFDKLAIKGDLSDFHKEILFDFVDDNSLYFIEFKKDLSVSSGAYFINVYQEKIECLYFDNEGLHNSVCTLRQLLLNINKLTTCRIYDEPFFKVRSVMIDISRNKVPKLETLKN